MTWTIGAVVFVLIVGYFTVLTQIIKPYQALVDFLHEQVAEQTKEIKDLRTKILAESERPWLAHTPVENGQQASVYYMDDEAMLKREREHDDSA
jgi:hypothetical protein